MEALSPINRAERVKTPLLLLHGRNDANVPILEAQQFADRLRGHDAKVALVEFPDEGHGFAKEANRERALVETVNWFLTNLEAR